MFFMYAYVRTYIYTYIYICIYTYTYIHMSYTSKLVQRAGYPGVYGFLVQRFRVKGLGVHTAYSEWGCRCRVLLSGVNKRKDVMKTQGLQLCRHMVGPWRRYAQAATRP